MNEANFAPAEAADFHPVAVVDTPDPSKLKEHDTPSIKAESDDVIEADFRPATEKDSAIPVAVPINRLAEEEVSEGEFRVIEDDAPIRETNGQGEAPVEAEVIKIDKDKEKEKESEKQEGEEDVIDAEEVKELSEEEYQERVQCQNARDWFKAEIQKEMAKDKPDAKRIEALNKLASMDDKQTREYINTVRDYCSSKLEGTVEPQAESEKPQTALVTQVARELDRIEISDTFPKERVDLVRDRILVLYLNPDHKNKGPEDFLTAKLLILFWLLAIAFSVGDKLARESFKALAPDLKSSPENQSHSNIPYAEQPKNVGGEKAIASAPIDQTQVPSEARPSKRAEAKPPELDGVDEVHPKLTGESVAQLPKESTVLKEAEEGEQQTAPAELVGEQPLQIADYSTHPDVQNQSINETEAPIVASSEATGDLFDKVTDSPEMAEVETQSATV